MLFECFLRIISLSSENLGLCICLFDGLLEVTNPVLSGLDLNFEAALLVSQSLTIIAKHLVQLTLNLGQLVLDVKLQLGTCLNVLTNRFQPLDVTASLIGNQFNLLESTAMPRLHQSLARVVECFPQLAILHRLLSLLREGLDAAGDLFLKNRNLLEELLNLVLLFASLANLIVVGGYTGDILEHLAALSRGHDCQCGDIALQHDVVSVPACASPGEEPANLCGGGGAIIEVVGRIDIPLTTEFDGASEPHFVGIDLHSARAVLRLQVGEDECRFAVLGGPSPVAPIENQFSDVLCPQTLRTPRSEHELYGVTTVGFPGAIGTCDPGESLFKRYSDLAFE